MKHFYESAVLQLLFIKSANLINQWKYSVIFFTKIFFEIDLPQISQKIRS